MQKIKTLLNELNRDQVLYFRIKPEDYEAFYKECREAGINTFFTGGTFRLEDVRSLMSIDQNHTVGYVSALCFFGSLNEDNTVNLDDHLVKIIHIDYTRMKQGGDYIIHSDHTPVMNGKPLQGRVLILQSCIQSNN